MSATPRPLRAKPTQSDGELLELLVREVRELRAEVRGMNRMRQALDAGRAKAIAEAKLRAAKNEQLVLHWAAVDIDRGDSSRGRAGRIAKRLRGLLSESQVRKILRALTSARDSEAPNQGGDTQGEEDHDFA